MSNTGRKPGSLKEEVLKKVESEDISVVSESYIQKVKRRRESLVEEVSGLELQSIGQQHRDSM